MHSGNRLSRRNCLGGAAMSSMLAAADSSSSKPASSKPKAAPSASYLDLWLETRVGRNSSQVMPSEFLLHFSSIFRNSLGSASVLGVQEPLPRTPLISFFLLNLIPARQNIMLGARWVSANRSIATYQKVCSCRKSFHAYLTLAVYPSIFTVGFRNDVDQIGLIARNPSS